MVALFFSPHPCKSFLALSRNLQRGSACASEFARFCLRRKIIPANNLAAAPPFEGSRGDDFSRQPCFHQGYSRRSNS